VVVLTVATSVGWSTARADIQDGLDDMLMVTGAEPAVYESQRRGGVTLGTFRVRAPLNSINLVNLTAPEIRAGCGGIDLYGGSFTFINTDQFRQILRQIGANAIGYAFKLALATMCQECDKILTGLQDMMNQFNKMNVDSCRWAQGMVNDTVKALGLKEKVGGELTASAVGDATDMFEAALEAFEEPGKWLKNGEPDGADPTKAGVGNLTWNALRIANVQALFGFAAGSLSHHEVLLNIAGTTIIRAPNDAEMAAGQEEDVTAVLTQRLTFAELKRGKIPSVAPANDANAMWECDTVEKCLSPTGLNKWDFPGTDAYVKTRLTTIADHMRVAATAGTPHDAADQQFLGQVPFDVVRHLVELQGSPGLDVYVEAASEAIGAYYAVALGETLAASIEAAFGRTDTLEMPTNVRANLDAFKADVNAERVRVTHEYMDTMQKLEELVDKLQIPNRHKPATLSTQAAK
jgi:conjugative transfer pilus assembly protein TraH